MNETLNQQRIIILQELSLSSLHTRAYPALPLPQKAAFLLHHDDELTVDELAQALGVGFETAKSRLRYGLAKLRTCMGAYLPAAEARQGWTEGGP